MRKTIEIDDPQVARQVLGVRDAHLRMVREALGVKVHYRGGTLTVEGKKLPVTRALIAFDEMRRVAESLSRLTSAQVERILDGLGADEAQGGGGAWPKERLVVGRGSDVEARTEGQSHYVRTMRENDVVFCVGPAGTGKTYLAVGMALSELNAGRVKRIALARPAVEAGERLGFLPGDERQKVNPYLRPLYDALTDMLSYSALARLIEQGVVEIVPLAFMRGRTLGNAFVILDEAQNTTSLQMLMFLTRLGRRARAVITGDVTQIDLPDPAASGLVEATGILDVVKGIGIVHLSERDIVRHNLVKSIVAAYEAGRPRGSRPRERGRP